MQEKTKKKIEAMAEIDFESVEKPSQKTYLEIYTNGATPFAEWQEKSMSKLNIVHAAVESLIKTQPMDHKIKELFSGLLSDFKDYEKRYEAWLEEQ